MSPDLSVSQVTIANKKTLTFFFRMITKIVSYLQIYLYRLKKYISEFYQNKTFPDAPLFLVISFDLIR